MGQPSTEVSTPPLCWDGKCQECRKLMSGCICFQEEGGDVDSLNSSATFQVTVDATKSRPLWNALRKMNRKSVARPILQQPFTASNPSNLKIQDQTRREVLPSSNAQSRPLSSNLRHQLQRISKSQTGKHESSLEPIRQTSSERLADRRQDRRHFSRFKSSFKGDAKNAGLDTMHGDVTAIHDIKEKLSYGPEEDENDETVWEL
ncbi:uncharacterized protein PHALS_13874 [Plasmopara halstedii]|uniref:Uncharacterized protein n=1 Tax=Plasmopara halstedii TaxID=4781 RepID=A0A0P1A496_PLAHL|nr:uncharacterized protein PHALS_13874 [Plasmopara halstedii]CEG35113.1 hypothetical protein PHALS_13874 [Plasmopara halstedii]|eukprot:XP_024571482.1 hypothetical protein PHALS_13874 [Plasmopara halstedii]